MSAVAAGGGRLVSEAELAFFAALAREHAGIVISPVKREMLTARLSKVLTRRGLATFGDYMDVLQSPSADDVAEFLDAVTTNLTAFFREPHHFDYLRDHALPALRQARRESRRLRIWSAGCSSGEEPYSLALVLDEALAGDEWDARILATDIDQTVLARAKRAVYPIERLADVPPRYRQPGFERGVGAQRGAMRVRPSIARRVSVRTLNLVDAWPMQARYDIIFCRNVIIYFDKSTQRELVDRFADLLQPQGLLCIGHSESLFQVSDRFESLGRTMYRKAA